MKSTIAAFGILAIGTGGSLALEGPGRALRQSDTVLQIANDPILTSAPGTQIKRAFIPPYSGSVRVKWQVRSANGGGVMTGGGGECELLRRGPASTRFVQKECTLRVVGGMPIEIYAQAPAPDVASLRNVRLYYTVVNARGESIIYEARGGM